MRSGKERYGPWTNPSEDLLLRYCTNSGFRKISELGVQNPSNCVLMLNALQVVFPDRWCWSQRVPANSPIYHHVDAFTTDLFPSRPFGAIITEDLHLCNQCWEYGQSTFPCYLCKFRKRVVGKLSSQFLIRIAHYPFFRHTGGWYTRKMRADTKTESIEADYGGKPVTYHETGLQLVISLWACLELRAGNFLYQLVRGEHSTSFFGPC